MRRVLAAMVTDLTVCSRVAGQWTGGGLFDQAWANMIGGWCVAHVREYGTAIGDQLEARFEDWARESNPEEATLKSIEKFLETTSNEYVEGEAAAADVLLDRAGRYFNKARLRKEIEEATDELDRNRVAEAHDRLVNISCVELGVGAVVKPAEDLEAWRRAFDAERKKQLVHYPGRLDQFLGEEMTRDSFVSFMASDKTGKSFFLLDLAFRSIRNRHRTAYFDVGDQSMDAVLRRLGSRAARVPYKPPLSVKMPTGVDKDGKVEVAVKQFDAVLTSGQAYKAVRRACRGKDLLRISCHPNSSIGVAGISGMLRDWSREGWDADVVVIDYADLLAPPAGIRDTLDQTDATWRYLRRMSQEMHCLVATATQASALAYSGKQRTLGKRHFSGRKTKLAHVNEMVGLNVTPDDKAKGVTRINLIVKRDGYYNERRYVTVAGCLAIANPVIRVAER